MIEKVPVRQIRAVYNDTTIRVYQAYSDMIADSALQHQTFVSPPFKRERMTWIKPSFLWMMYRAGWGYKDEGQRRILAIDISREGFESALAHSCASHPEPGIDAAAWEALKRGSPVRVQWDPERDLHLRPLEHRAIQIGLGGEAVERYTGEWILGITEVTEQAQRMQALVEEGRLKEATGLLPEEREYVVGTLDV